MSRLAHPIVFVQDPIPPEIDAPLRELGRKGLSLRRLADANLRVPRGFTVRAEVCRWFLDNEGIWPEEAWEVIQAGIQRLETETGRPFTSTVHTTGSSCNSLRLAVRSGAAVSMPGLLTTMLNIGADQNPGGVRAQRATDPFELLRSAIEHVFQSWNHEAARDYRRTHGIDHSMRTAVTVQEMIVSQYSGVLFTRSPEPDAADSMTIEAVAGHGDQLVAGRTDPYRWTVLRDESGRIRSPDDSQQIPSRLTGLLPELCRIGLRLEATFECPLDIEWGIDRAGLVFFQTRPITSPAIPTQLDDVVERECERLHTLAASGARLWVRHNLDQTLPHPTPLTWSLWRQFMSGGGGLGTLYRRLGYRPSKRVEGDGFLLLIGGRIFADPDRARRMFGDGFPFHYDLTSLRADTSTLDKPPTQFDPDYDDPLFLWRLPAFLTNILRTRRKVSRLFVTAADRFEQQVLPPYLERVSQLQHQDLKALNPHELLSLFESRRRLVLDEFGPESLLPGMLGAVAYSEFERQLVRVLGAAAGRSLARDLVPDGDVTLIQRQQELLAACVSLPGEVDTFLEEFGHRAIGEMELATPRWRETPSLVAQLVDSHDTPRPAVAVASSDDATYATAARRLRDEFSFAGGRSLVSDAEAWLDRYWRFLPYRERGKHMFLKGYELLRQVAEELGERFDLGSRIYRLTIEEWPKLEAGTDFRQMIAERHREASRFRRMRLPEVIDAQNIDVIRCHDSISTTSTQSWKGTPLVGGQATGQVWNAGNSPWGDAASAEHVLVCQALEPAMGPLLGRLCAVVVEQGGTLSHGAILARQCGLPVVRLPGATDLLMSGQSLHVDGTTGCISVINGDPS